MLFKIGEAAKRLKVTKRTLSHYIEIGLLVPDQQPERPGMLNKFGEKNLYEVLLIQELQRTGFDLKTIKQAMPWSEAEVAGNKQTLMVIYDGHTEKGSLTISAAKPDGTYRLKMAGRKSATVIDLSGLRDKAKELAI
jgi:DNA-binding transcriptional MerR regulator